MEKHDLILALQPMLANETATDLVENWITLRRDVATNTLEKAVAGKFVESLVQALQYVERGSYDPRPDVDRYLREAENGAPSLPEDLRICATRVARAMYTMRNKRNIAHKGAVDPNVYDLRLLHAQAQWILAELIRQAKGGSMAEAGVLMERVQLPISAAVEDFGAYRLVLDPRVSVDDEILLLLHSHYPEWIPRSTVGLSLSRRSTGGVTNALRALWEKRLVESRKRKNSEGRFVPEYKLTQAGYAAADAIADSHA